MRKGKTAVRPFPFLAAATVAAAVIAGCASDRVPYRETAPHPAAKTETQRLAASHPDLFPARTDFVKSTEAQLAAWGARARKVGEKATSPRTSPTRRDALAELESYLTTKIAEIRHTLGGLNGDVVPPWSAAKMKIEDRFDDMSRRYYKTFAE